MYIVEHILRNKILDASFISMRITSDRAQLIANALRLNTSIKTMNFSSAFMNDASFSIIADAIIARNIKLDLLILDFTKITKNSYLTIVSLFDKNLISKINMYWLDDYDDDQILRDSLSNHAMLNKVILSYTLYPIPPKMPNANEINAFFKAGQPEEKENFKVDERKDFKPN